MSLFPVPVSGQPIPRGWFARLVRFVNSLILRGDGSYLAVKHTPDGTLISPTPYLIDQLAQAGRAGGSGGGASGIAATVSGGTASVTASGSNPLIIVPANANIQLSVGTTGELMIGASAVTGAPDYNYNSQGYLEVFFVQNDQRVSQTYNQTVWLIGTFNVNTSTSMSGAVQISIGALHLIPFVLTIGSTSLAGLSVPFSYLVPANTNIEFYAQDNAIAEVYVVPTL